MVFASKLCLQGSKGSAPATAALAVESRDTWRSVGSVQGVGVIGAIAGDIIGSVYEFRPIKTKDFPLFSPFCDFTDDTVLTVAVADAILTGRSYLEAVREIGRRYPDAGYGGFFYRWLHSKDSRPYNSWGNGSAMRVSPIGFAFQDEESVLKEAARTAEITLSPDLWDITEKFSAKYGIKRDEPRSIGGTAD